MKDFLLNVVNCIKPVFECFNIKTGEAMAVLLNLVAYILVLNHFGLNWNVEIVVFFICTTALLNNLFLWICVKCEHSINKKNDIKNFYSVLSSLPSETKNFLNIFIEQNCNTITTNENYHHILNYLRFRNVNIEYLGNNCYQLKPYLFDILKSSSLKSESNML